MKREIEVILSLFTSKGYGGVYDYMGQYYNFHVRGEKSGGEVGKRGCIWGEMVWSNELMGIVEEYMVNDRGIDEFRKEGLWEILKYVDVDYVEDIDEREEYFSDEDIGEAMRLIVENKIWKDEVVKGQIGFFYKIKRRTDKASRRLGAEEVVISVGGEGGLKWEGIDWSNGEIYYTEAFEKLEKANWKRFVLPEYHDFLERVDLTGLKRNLKDEIGRVFCPKGWQGEFLVKSNRYNFVVGGRRCGKTFFGAGYLAIRQTMLPKQDVVYIVPTLKNHAIPAWEAMSSYLSADIFSNYSMDKENRLIRNNLTGSKIRFVTAARKGGIGARGSAAHLLVFDEMAFIDETTFETVLPLVATTNGMVYGISTVNPETPKNFFYYNLVKAEMEMYRNNNTEYYANRVTLDNNPFISDEEKQKIKNRVTNADLFNAEWMCTFMDSSSFNTSSFWIINENPIEMLVDGRWKTYRDPSAFDKTMAGVYSKYLIIYDAAKRVDMPGLMVIGLKSGGGAQVLMADYAEKFGYLDQVSLIFAIEKLLGGEKMCEIVIDYRNAGAVIEEILVEKGRYPVCVSSKGGQEEGRIEGGVFSVGKLLMKNKLASALERGKVKGGSFLRVLRNEFELWSDDDMNTRKHGHHFDVLSCFMMGIRWAERCGFLIIEEEPASVARVRGDFDRMEQPPKELFYTEEEDPYERMAKFGW